MSIKNAFKRNTWCFCMVRLLRKDKKYVEHNIKVFLTWKAIWFMRSSVKVFIIFILIPYYLYYTVRLNLPFVGGKDTKIYFANTRLVHSMYCYMIKLYLVFKYWELMWTLKMQIPPKKFPAANFFFFFSSLLWKYIHYKCFHTTTHSSDNIKLQVTHPDRCAYCNIIENCIWRKAHLLLELNGHVKCVKFWC